MKDEGVEIKEKKNVIFSYFTSCLLDTYILDF